MTAQTMPAPCISVIIPTYNRRGLLPRAVSCALTQTEQDVEVIIADDGSTDGTETLFEGEQDPRIRYCRLPHKGACAARNAGINLARGKYIAFLDSDDVWHDNKLAKQKAQLERTDADVVFCAFLRHNLEDGTKTRWPMTEVSAGRIDGPRLLGGNLVSTQTIFGKAECMRRVRFDEQFPRMQDWEFAIRLAESCTMLYFPEVLVDVYIQSDSISKKPELALQALRLLYDKHRTYYAASYADTMTMAMAMHQQALLCRRCCRGAYGKMLSLRRTPSENFRIAYHGLRFMAQEWRAKSMESKKG